MKAINSTINKFLEKRNRKFLFLFIFFIFILASISVLHGLYLANTSGGVDFQYSTTVLFLEKINPYEYFIDGNLDNRIMRAHWPIYSHVLYLLLAPFGFLEWEIARFIWSIINFITALCCVILISKFCKLKVFETIIVCLIFFGSSGFRNCITNGNQTFFVLLFFQNNLS